MGAARRLGVLAALVAALTLLPAGAALAHATLESSIPSSGQTFGDSPPAVIMRFSEGVTVGLGALRVYDARGRQVQQGRPYRPGGRADEVAILLRDLPDGGYTATYRVISADSHPVEGGFSFAVGDGAAAAPAVDRLLQGQASGPVTTTSFALVRAVQYLAIAALLGVIGFFWWAWLPALRHLAGGEERWRVASERFADRMRAIVATAAVAGLVASVAGLVLQGAVSGGTSVWRAVDPAVVGAVLETRFGVVWALAALAWGASILIVVRLPQTLSALRPASVGATGLALPDARPLAGLAIPALALAMLPLLSGHALVQRPVLVLAPANAVHVVAVSLWLGGIATLAVGLRSATGALEHDERTRLLSAVLGRFSTLAGVAVALVVASGVTQAVVEVASLRHLVDTAYGRAVLVKLVVVLAIVACGALHRRRLLPALRAAAAADGGPGVAGVLVRRVLRLELLVGVAAIAATGALSGYPPSTAVASGPWSGSAIVGSARLEMTVDPARSGANSIHLYAFERRTGRQFTGFQELQADAVSPVRGVGRIDLVPRKAGPGHWQLDRTLLTPAGSWTIRLTVRTSAFDEQIVRFKVPIR